MGSGLGRGYFVAREEEGRGQPRRGVLEADDGVRGLPGME